MSWTAILLAGERPGGDPFARQFGAKLKALIPIAGEPMILRPLRALMASERVEAILVFSQRPDELRPVIPELSHVELRASRATIAETLLELIDDPTISWPLLVTTADHALLDTAMIDEFCTLSAQSDVAIAVVERERLMTRLKGTKRTWLKFRGGAFTGANLFALRSRSVAAAIEKWRVIEKDRKKGWKIVWALGPVTVAGIGLRMMTIDGALAHLGRSLGLSISAVRLSNPLAGVDVDKPDDHFLVEKILEGSQ